MQIHHYQPGQPVPDFKNAVITIGTFDGVHAGHRQILDKIIKEAKEVEGESVIITFHPHPRKIVSSTILGVRLITTLDERMELLAQLGIDHVVVVPFTDIFSSMPAEDYIKNFLVNLFQPHTIIIGYDHQFGRDRAGNYRLLEKLKHEYNYRLKEIPKHIIEDIAISSTNIREAILHNDTTTTNLLLGYPFFFSGKVVHGQKLGRTLGYPTANIKVEDNEKIIPANGIYAVLVEIHPPDTALQQQKEHLPPFEKKWKGMMSIGFRPTVNGKTREIEVNIFDFDYDIYDLTIKVHVISFLRQEVKFDNLEKMVQQIDQDKVDSLRVLG